MNREREREEFRLNKVCAQAESQLIVQPKIVRIDK